MKRWLGCIAGILVVAFLCQHFTRPRANTSPEPPPLPATRTIMLRIYANTPSDPVYALVADGGDMCLVDKDTWLMVYVGQPYACVWKGNSDESVSDGN